MIPSVFISREIKEDSILLDLDVDLFAASLIQIEIQNDCPSLDQIDWIFFSSKRGIEWAEKNEVNLTDFKLGAVGSGTADYLLKKGFRLEFIGEDDKKVEEISADFDTCVSENEKVLFPLSSRSKKTILKNFRKSYETCLAYTTEFDPILFQEDFDYLVFTSPSNFLSFFSANSISADSKVIAMGETTKNEISKYLNIPIFIPNEKNEKGIYELLQKLISTTDSD